MFHKKYLVVVAIFALLTGLVVLMKSVYFSQNDIRQVGPIHSQSQQTRDSTATIGKTQIDKDEEKIEKNNWSGSDLDWMLPADAHEGLGLVWDNFTVDLKLSNCTRSEISDFFEGLAIKGTSADRETARPVEYRSLFPVGSSAGSPSFHGWSAPI